MSELVSNAIVHAQGMSLLLSAEVDERRVRVEVHDEGHGFAPPDAPAPGEPSTSGWGLYLVRRLADRWGVTNGRRTCVWLELDRP